jgi:DNA-binding transcriptional LysR family regulator
MDHWILPDLVVFLEVVRAGSLTRAAERLHTVQSNVTARIKQLERVTGTTLLQRHARGIRLTPAGEAALVLAQRLDAVMADLQQTFGQGARPKVKLRLGSIETIAASHLPAAVARFVRLHPAVEISIQTGSSSFLLKLLKSGEVDAVFVSRAPKLAGHREHPVFTDELTIVAPRSVKNVASLLSAGPPIKVLVQRLGCSYTERLLGYLAQKSRRGYQLQELGTLEGVLGFVEVGAGVAAMPKAFALAAAGQRKLRLLPLPVKIARLQSYLVAPAREDVPFIVNEFVTSLDAQPGSSPDPAH